MVATLLSREMGKTMSSGQYCWLPQEAANCWQSSGCSASELLQCFPALAQQCYCLVDRAEAVLLHSTTVSLEQRKQMLCIIKKKSYKLITMEEFILHQNEELSCPPQSNLQDLLLWPR